MKDAASIMAKCAVLRELGVPDEVVAPIEGYAAALPQDLQDAAPVVLESPSQEDAAGLRAAGTGAADHSDCDYDCVSNDGLRPPSVCGEEQRQPKPTTGDERQERSSERR